ncbi:MAG: GH92 family glycosyl hydrolase [Bacteroidota bacterium]
MISRYALAILLLFTIHNGFAQTYTKWVDPFLGTGGHGHVYPGATVPFGMVQVSPDNGVEGWDWCSGYHYSSTTIAGFSHTHLSGTGIGDWCDISVLPLTDTTQVGSKKIFIPFQHQNEKAEPGYYSVILDNKIKVELTAADRTGYHRYTFPANKGWVRFDMGFAINWDQSTAGQLQLIDSFTLVGYRFSTGWAKGQKVFFAARFNTPVQQLVFIDDSTHSRYRAVGKQVKALLEFNTSQPLEFSVALSSVSTEKAQMELYSQLNNQFDQVAQKATNRWERELEKIKIDTTNRDLAIRFYTALYRTSLAPVVQSDADGQYQTHDNKIRRFTNGVNKYTIFSQWDVFRASNPLFTLLQPERYRDMLNSMLAFYDDNGLLPVWDISTWEANTMTGYHSVPILADAILKEIKGFDIYRAYEAMKKSANQSQRGTPAYLQYGYVPHDKHGWSVTTTLEYAFDDWCIAQVAKKLGRQADFQLYSQRANSYKALFDSTTGFFRARLSNGQFKEPFDPLLSEHGFEGQYIEGTAWQHSFFVPHDVEGFARLHGGKEKLLQKLDSLFTAPSELHGQDVSIDVTGLIGQYAHGNEPSHHIIYLYTALGAPEKAAHWVRVVADSMYKNGPDGLTGNDDCGQMSAWYIWSSLGMYPLNPASGQYVFGLPLIKEAVIELTQNKKVKIQVLTIPGQGKKGIAKVKWNKKEIPLYTISHQQLQEGGTLTYYVYE